MAGGAGERKPGVASVWGEMPFRSLVILAALVGELAAGPAKLTAADYEASPIQGWTVHVEKSLSDHPRRAEALALLEKKLVEITARVPAAALPKLKEVPLWLSRDASPGACYHPSAGWLKANGRVVEMARAIEFQNIDHFLDWSGNQPQMVLHELAHAWHHRCLPGGYDNPRIRAAFEAAVATKKYEKVRHAGGREQRHYALTNPMEYFAEATEAYFGRNDFQPFDRVELKDFDPAGHQLVEEIWGIAPR
jgi:hypothetical protein